MISPAPTLSRRIAAECAGTALLMCVVTGSGIMAARLARGDEALALLANAIATGVGLVAIIETFASISAQFNPVVTLAAMAQGAIVRREVPMIVAAQIGGAFIGLGFAHGMFAEPLALSNHARGGVPQIFSEVIATAGLLLVIEGVGRRRPERVAQAVGAYITAAYWFTSSTSFANPALTLARAATDTFVGIRPLDVPGFWLGQGVGAAVAIGAGRWLFAKTPKEGSA
jgi:glycerol uptake facilitator-like aquaporin